MEGKLFTDTSDFCSIDYGDSILVGGTIYIVTGHERERRFGMEEPKFWVKKAYNADSGEKKIIKLSFFESFETNFGGVQIRCFRNPKKEGDILELVKNHPAFMHGKAYKDIKENTIRVIDLVNGSNFFMHIDSISMGHEMYFHTVLPGILKKLVKAFEAARFLHINGFRHGDIRNDHIIIERSTGNYVWIDFDYDYETSENPFGLDIFGLGNILLYAIGKGFHSLHMIDNDPFVYGDLRDRLEPKDFSILNKWRFLNLRKLYPYIPVMVNDVLMHFSKGSELFYESVDEIIEDINRCIYSVF